MGAQSQMNESANVDKSVTFKGWGVTHVKSERKQGASLLEPVEYHPRKLGENDVEIKISHCGICASDIHTATEGWGPLIRIPTIVGHEIVGTVEKVGSKVSKFQQGQRVAVGPMVFSCLNRKGDCGNCQKQKDQHCSRATYTYNSKYEDGETAQGGYQERMRVDENYVFPVPDPISSEEVAPLMCAGVTVYTPLARHGAKKGKRVGVIGVGGLGHLAIQFAAKMGAEVISISTSKSKETDAKKLGAKEHLDINDQEHVKKLTGSIDLILNTANGADMQYDLYFSLLKFGGTFVQLAAPETPLSLRGSSLIFKEVNFTGSLVGSIQDTQNMLEFAAKHNVRPMIEILPMSQCNEGVKKVDENNVRYRVVLKN